MFSHDFVGVSDFDRALALYRAHMPVLGNEERLCDPARPWAGWQSHSGPRPEYHEHHFGACFRDTEGDKRLVACHSAPG